MKFNFNRIRWCMFTLREPWLFCQILAVNYLVPNYSRKFIFVMLWQSRNLLANEFYRSVHPSRSRLTFWVRCPGVFLSSGRLFERCIFVICGMGQLFAQSLARVVNRTSSSTHIFENELRCSITPSKTRFPKRFYETIARRKFFRTRFARDENRFSNSSKSFVHAFRWFDRRSVLTLPVRLLTSSR